MATTQLLTVLLSIGLAVAAIVLAAVAWARINELSLSVPVALPALNVVIPIATALAWPLAQRVSSYIRKHTSRLTSALPYLAYASSLAPFILLVLSLVYASPSDLRLCAADQQWLRMFRNKDAAAVRTIQTRLQCCGYNSMHDRAWPFPSRGVNATACERTQGYTIACGDLWRHQQTTAATLTAIASFLNWLMMVYSFP
jgi:hypothetical protein